MSSGGFPTRPTRNAFGPERVNDGVPPDADKYVDAETFNLEHWQTAGLGVVASRAWAVLNWTGSVLELVAAGEAWDPNGTQANPTPARASAGVYTLTYAATYANRLGAAVAPALIAGKASVQALGGDWAAVAVPRVDGRTVDVELVNAGTPGDAKVLVELW